MNRGIRRSESLMLAAAKGKGLKEGFSQAAASASANCDYRNEQRVSDGAPAGALDSSVTAGVLDSSYF